MKKYFSMAVNFAGIVVIIALLLLFSSTPAHSQRVAAECDKPAVQYLKDAQRYTKEAENLKDSDGMVPKEAIKKTDLRVAALLSLEWYKLCLQLERGLR